MVFMFHHRVCISSLEPYQRCAQILVQTFGRLRKLRFLRFFTIHFSCQPDDVVEVSIEVRQNGNYVERRTICTRKEIEVASSDWTKIKR